MSVHFYTPRESLRRDDAAGKLLVSRPAFELADLHRRRDIRSLAVVRHDEARAKESA